VIFDEDCYDDVIQSNVCNCTNFVSFVVVWLSRIHFKKPFSHVYRKVCKNDVLLHSLVNQILECLMIKKSCVLEVVLVWYIEPTNTITASHISTCMSQTRFFILSLIIKYQSK
jgi:hypothetical protein